VQRGTDIFSTGESWDGRSLMVVLDTCAWLLDVFLSRRSCHGGGTRSHRARAAARRLVVFDHLRVGDRQTRAEGEALFLDSLQRVDRGCGGGPTVSRCNPSLPESASREHGVTGVFHGDPADQLIVATHGCSGAPS